MPRKPSIRYFPSRRAYYSQIKGRQYLLSRGPQDEPDGPTWERATLKFAYLLAKLTGERHEEDPRRPRDSRMFILGYEQGYAAGRALAEKPQRKDLFALFGSTLGEEG